MAKHTAGGEARTSNTYIGRHRERTEVRDDPQGWAIGRGVSPESVTDHTRNS